MHDKYMGCAEILALSAQWYWRESSREAQWYNSDCLQPKLPAGGPQLFMNYFCTSHQNNKTEKMLDNENQMHRDVQMYWIYFFMFFLSDFFRYTEVFSEMNLSKKKKHNNNIIINNNNI